MRTAFARFGFLALLVSVHQACAVFQPGTPADRAVQALDAVDAAERGVEAAGKAADTACDVYATAVVFRQVKADPEVTGRCNARGAAKRAP
jgi:hypothetical protein